MALCALLIILLCGIAPYASAAKLHHLDIGFNLGYPDRVHFFEPALAEIQRLGIRDVRIYEVFDGRVGNSYQIRLKRALNRVLARGMHPMLTISNMNAHLQRDALGRLRVTAQLPLWGAAALVRTILIQTKMTYVNSLQPCYLAA